MNILLYWILLGSISANLLWCLDDFIKNNNRTDAFTKGLPLTFIIGPLGFIYFMYRYIDKVIMENK